MSGFKIYRKRATVEAKIFMAGDEDGIHKNNDGSTIPYVRTAKGKMRGHYEKNYLCVGSDGEKILIAKALFESTYEEATPLVGLHFEPLISVDKKNPETFPPVCPEKHILLMNRYDSVITNNVLEVKMINICGIKYANAPNGYHELEGESLAVTYKNQEDTAARIFVPQCWCAVALRAWERSEP